MSRGVVVIIAVVLASATVPRYAFALGCDAKTQTPGHRIGNIGITDIPTTPCPVGHCANLQKKRTGSALYTRPTGLSNPQLNQQQQ